MSTLNGLKTTLITGASAGIGAELALLFAARGFDLILVARREERLEALSRQIVAMHDVKTHIITSDLCIPGAGSKLYAKTQDLGLEVDVLINNAGIGQYGNFAKADHTLLIDMIRLNMEALTELTHMYLPNMLARDRGAVMNVASTAGFQSGPGMAVYYATKAYVLSFSDALVEELRDTNVTISNLCPGATNTEFQKVAKMESSRLFSGSVSTPSEVAKAGIQGLDKGVAHIVPGIQNKIGVFGTRFMPRALLRRVVHMVNTDL